MKFDISVAHKIAKPGPKPKPKDEKEEGDGSDLGLILGLTFGGLALVLIGAFFFIRY